jgi:hypothetical protein
MLDFRVFNSLIECPVASVYADPSIKAPNETSAGTAIPSILEVKNRFSRVLQFLAGALARLQDSG